MISKRKRKICKARMDFGCSKNRQILKMGLKPMRDLQSIILAKKRFLTKKDCKSRGITMLIFKKYFADKCLA